MKSARHREVSPMSALCDCGLNLSGPQYMTRKVLLDWLTSKAVAVRLVIIACIPYNFVWMCTCDYMLGTVPLKAVFTRGTWHIFCKKSKMLKYQNI